MFQNSGSSMKPQARSSSKINLQKKGRCENCQVKCTFIILVKGTFVHTKVKKPQVIIYYVSISM